MALYWVGNMSFKHAANEYIVRSLKNGNESGEKIKYREVIAFLNSLLTYALNATKSVSSAEMSRWVCTLWLESDSFIYFIKLISC